MALTCALCWPTVAVAAVGWVECTSQGATGAKATTNVLHRFPGIDEGYFVALDNQSVVRHDGARPSIAWEIYEWKETPGVFHPVAHILFADGESTYPDDEFVNIKPQIVTGGGAWHTLAVQQKAAGSISWNCYVDGVFIDDYWWKHTTSDTAWSAVESYPDPLRDLNSSDYFFIGRNDNFYLRTSKGVWDLFDSAWSSRLSYGVENAPAYAVHFNNSFYDFEVRR